MSNIKWECLLGDYKICCNCVNWNEQFSDDGRNIGDCIVADGKFPGPSRFPFNGCDDKWVGLTIDGRRWEEVAE